MDIMLIPLHFAIENLSLGDCKVWTDDVRESQAAIAIIPDKGNKGASKAVSMRTRRLWDPGDTGDQWHVDSRHREGNAGKMLGLGKRVSGDFLVKIENL